jgi:hypothetical protein
VTDLLNRIRMEFIEMPGLRLTAAQARRLWDLPPRTCDAVLDTLVGERFLRRTADGAFLRTGITPPAAASTPFVSAVL